MTITEQLEKSPDLAKMVYGITDELTIRSAYEQLKRGKVTLKQKSAKAYNTGFQDGFDHAVTNVRLYLKSVNANAYLKDSILQNLFTFLENKKLESERVNNDN